MAWAAANVWIQRAGRENGELRSMLWAQLLGASVLVPIAWMAGEVPTAVPWRGLLLAGIGSAAGYFGMLRAFRFGPLSVMAPILSSWAASAWGFSMAFGEVPTAVHAVGAACVVLGAVGNGAWSTGGEWHGPRHVALGWALVCSLGFGLMTAAIPLVREELGVVLTTPVVWGAQWVVLLPALVRDPGLLRPPQAWRALAAMAALEASGFLAYTFATTHAPVTVVSPPASLAAVLTVAWCGVTGTEAVPAGRWALVALAAAGTVLLAR